MKTKLWLAAFLTNWVVELAAHALNWSIHLVTKPLLMLLLIGYFVSILKGKKGTLKTSVVIALLFSWAGDTFLLFQKIDTMYFILGLVAFLLAHVTYIVGFSRLKGTANNAEKAIIIILFSIYSTSLFVFLWPGLGEMKIPVLLYTVVLTTMGIVGVMKNTVSYPYITLGVLSFVVSDTVLAFNKFLIDIPYEGVIIMATYVLAQFLIVFGVSKRILSGPIL